MIYGECINYVKMYICNGKKLHIKQQNIKDDLIFRLK